MAEYEARRVEREGGRRKEEGWKSGGGMRGVKRRVVGMRGVKRRVTF